MAIRLFISDIDGTAVQYPYGKFQSTWNAIGYHGPNWQAWQEVILEYSGNPDRWQEWTERNMKILKGADSRIILNKILPPPYTPGFEECVRYAKSKGIYVGFVSGGVNLVAQYIVQDLGMDFHYSNEIHVDEKGIFTGTGKNNVFMDTKGKIIRDLQNRYGISREETLFVGDHKNDIPAWREAGIRVGMNLKQEDLGLQVDYKFTNFFELKELLQEYLK